MTAQEFLQKAMNDAKNWFKGDKPPGPPDSSTAITTKGKPGDPLKDACKGGAAGPG